MAWRKWVFMVLLALSGAAPSFASEPRIIEKVISGGFKIVIVDFVGANESEAQAMIGPLIPQWGRFTLKAMIANHNGKPLKPGRFEQEIRCITPPTAEAAGQTPAFAPTAADEQFARDTALKFLRLRDVGNAEATFVMLTDSMQQTTDRKAWVSEASTGCGWQWRSEKDCQCDLVR
jgi:hypothetical protein